MTLYSQSQLAKLRWHCRRGMLELDMLLLPFFDAYFEKLSDALQAQFVALLDCSDQDLWRWLLGYQICPEENLLNIISKIRQYAMLSKVKMP
ncbi:MAG: succinate dehydrogenase assembly factor 2 [Gammaproteobacteria bacterium]